MPLDEGGGPKGTLIVTRDDPAGGIDSAAIAKPSTTSSVATERKGSVRCSDRIRRILETRQLPEPDGRPLYAYKVSDDELAAVARELCNDVASRRSIHHEAAAAFCLYGAEYFSRGDGSDWWVYEGVTRDLPLELPEQDLRDAIAAGLGFWRRRVLAGTHRRHYLGTLVSEGGLPLALLQNEGGRLRRYFADLLRQHESYPTIDVSRLAAELAGTLPVTMQNAVVYALAAALVQHVAYLRNPLAHSEGEPPPAPLRLDSEPAQQLIDGLRSAPRPRADVEPGIAIRTTLNLTAAPLLRRQIVLPRTVSTRWLTDAIPGLRELPARWYLSLLTATGARWSVAVATQDVDGFALAPTAARDIVRQGSVTEQVRCVISFGGADLGSFVPRGAEALSDTPWNVSDVGEGGALRATASWRSSAPSLLVAMPLDTAVETDDGAVVEQLGEIVDLGRQLLRLRGTLQSTRDGEIVVIASGAGPQADRVFELRGHHAPESYETPTSGSGGPGWSRSTITASFGRCRPNASSGDAAAAPGRAISDKRWAKESSPRRSTAASFGPVCAFFLRTSGCRCDAARGAARSRFGARRSRQQASLPQKTARQPYIRWLAAST